MVVMKGGLLYSQIPRNMRGAKQGVHMGKHQDQSGGERF